MIFLSIYVAEQMFRIAVLRRKWVRDEDGEPLGQP